MELNDYVGSFAQENVAFSTQVVKQAIVGDNFWKTMVFIETDRFVDTSQAGWTKVPGVPTAMAISVNNDTYAEFTNGLLKGWLYDLYASGATTDTILVAYVPKATVDTATASEASEDEKRAPITALTAVYGAMKAYAYHKTILVGADTLDTDVALTALGSQAVELSKLCTVDKQVLSSMPYLPYTGQTSAMNDVLYVAMKTAKADAYMSQCSDKSRNASLFALGLALSTINDSGTRVGNQFDMWATGLMSMSTVEDNSGNVSEMPRAVRSVLNSNNVATWKPIGNNTGNVAAEGSLTLNGDPVAANWIVAYITYMSKVGIAELITQPEFYKTSENYARIIGIMSGYIGQMSRTGHLQGAVITAPAFGEIPETSSREIVIPHAWEATYIDTVNKVTISGTLYIAA